MKTSIAWLLAFAMSIVRTGSASYASGSAILSSSQREGE